MARYLVVANVTLEGDHLVEMLRERAARGPCEVHIVVPAAQEIVSWRSHDLDTDTAEARQRLDRALARFTAIPGVQATGEVGDRSPVQAVGDVLRHQAPFDELILSTLPSGPSRWLRMDTPARLERAWGLPVTHVVARREAVRGNH